MNNELQKAFEKLEETRNAFFSSREFNGDIHTRVEDGKWSIAESIYHCYKLVKITKISLELYLPLSRLVIRTVRCNNKDNEMSNIYAGATMPAPFILVPANVDDLDKGKLRHLLEVETRKINELVQNLTKREVYCIRLPDPVPNYPNIIQTIKLLEIHERHHYEIVTKRQQASR